MKTLSNDIPKRLLDLGNGHYHINFGLEQKTEIDENNVERTSYNYEAVEVNGEPNFETITEPTYDTVVDALITDKFTKGMELAFINNYLLGKELTEFAEYQRIRRVFKYIANKIGITTKEELSEII
jgi:hypothetical protein